MSAPQEARAVLAAAMRLYDTDKHYGLLARAGADNPEAMMVRRFEEQRDIDFTQLIELCRGYEKSLTPEQYAAIVAKPATGDNGKGAPRSENKDGDGADGG